MRVIGMLVILFEISLCTSYKILCVAPVASRSHFILMSSLAKGLAEAGHNITIIAPFKETKLPKNGSYREVYTGISDDTQEIPINFFNLGQLNPFEGTMMVWFVGYMYANLTLTHPNFLKFIESNETFDAIIIEQFVNDATKGIANHYQAPLILFSTLGANDWVNNWVGNPSVPSYIPDILLNYSYDMNFYERTVNVLLNIFKELYRRFIFFPSHEKLMRTVFPEAPDLNTLNYNVSLVLINSHESVNQAVPHVPCMVQIGGFHVDPPKKLPKDLKKFLDEAEEGFIYFSLGSNVKPSQMTNETKEAIITSFSKLKQKVLWKWDGDQLDDQPANVMISKWLPQQDILAHPNIKVFITHGGLLSITETIHHGVPILIIPIFGDQMLNGRRAENNGFALTLPYIEITEERLTECLEKLLFDPKYRAEAKYRSTLMHDRPMKPIDLAVYSVEFVIRHKGAQHLKVGGVHLPWYRYFLLDVIGFLTTVVLVVCYIIFIILKKCICSRSNKSSKIKIN